MYNKQKYDRQIKDRFGLPSTSKITYFRNPKEFRYFNIEYINPTHKALLWGLLKRKYRNNTSHKIRVGKIKISFSILFIKINEYFTCMFNYCLANKSIPELCLDFFIACFLFTIFYQLSVTNQIFLWKFR